MISNSTMTTKELWLINEAKDKELSEFYLSLACDVTGETQEILLDQASEYAKLSLACKIMSYLV